MVTCILMCLKSVGIAILYQDITGIDIFVSVSYEITLLEEMFILGKAGYSCRTAPLRWRY